MADETRVVILEAKTKGVKEATKEMAEVRFIWRLRDSTLK